MTPNKASEVRERLLGTWKLVSTEETLKSGSTRPFPQFGPHGEGLLMYQADGYMCAILGNPDKAAGTFAYSGRYEIDALRRHIVHVPEIATNPAWVGSHQVRPYQFEDGHLIFSDIENNDPAVARWKIIWRKVA